MAPEDRRVPRLGGHSGRLARDVNIPVGLAGADVHDVLNRFVSGLVNAIVASVIVGANAECISVSVAEDATRTVVVTTLGALE